MSEITLESLVKELRLETETLFGKPFTDWTYLGIEFVDNGPSLFYYRINWSVTIGLSNYVKSDIRQLAFQLAHEVCHLLYPSKTKNNLENKPTILNEGLATYFQIKKMEDYFGLGQNTIESIKELNSNYYEAYVLVNCIIAEDVEAIKKLRIRKPRLDEVKLEDFKVLNFEISDTIKRKLISHF